MKTLFSMMFLLLAISFSNDASAAGKYTCKQTGDSVCVVNNYTGQCTHSFSREDHGNPMYACRAFIGEIDTRVNRNNYYCDGNRDRACARSKIHGQCTHEWTSRDGGGDAMYQCQRWMNPNMGRIDKSKYVCSGDSDRVCARNTQTGQCTHVWTRRDNGDPWFACRSWLRK